ncbi:Delta(3,5)-Delta(2,4)-dienoyl-CoA isomerase, peroxisomal [Balamuthia mandrillaris]
MASRETQQAVAAYTTLRIDRRDNGVAEVVLCRAKQLNTMTPTFFEELGRAFKELDEDETVRVVLLWAEGRVFTAGLDLKAASLLMPDTSKSRAAISVEFMKMLKKWQGSMTQIQECKKPVIAAVHSHCIGGGVDLVTACDIRICTEDASFSIAETKLAIVADLGTLQRITRIVGKGVAREMAFTSEPLSAERSLRHGLVTRVYKDKEALLEAGRAMAQTIADLSPLVVQGTKKVLEYAEEHTLAEGLQHVGLWNAAFLHSEDLVEAMMAFMQKRKPSFKNNL